MGYLSIEGATIIDGTGGTPIQDGCILLQETKIANVGPAGSFDLPSERQTMDATGKVVTPGLIDAHNHLCIYPGDEAKQMSDPDGTLMLRAVRHARANLASGVTTMRTVGERSLLDLQYRDGIAEGLIPGPRILASAWPICSTGGHGWFIGKEVDGVAAARQAVRDNCKAGADLIKIMVSGGVSTKGSVPWTCYFAQDEIEALIDEAHRLGKKVAGHLYGGQGADWALAAGMDTVEHGSYLSDEQLDVMASKGIWLVATQGVYLLRPKDTTGIPPWQQRKAVDAAESTKRVFQKAMEKGVNIAFGTDCHHEPFRMADELALAVGLGMSEMDAIVQATAGAAQASGIESDVGTLTPGKWADLLILGSDPLTDIQALKDIETIVQAGKIVEL